MKRFTKALSMLLAIVMVVVVLYQALEKKVHYAN